MIKKEIYLVFVPSAWPELLKELWEIGKAREAWHAAVHGVEESDTT